MPFDGVTYLCCVDCGSFVVEGEADAHERGCAGARLVCRVCSDRVAINDLRAHLIAHIPNAENLDPGEVRDQFTADAATEQKETAADNSKFLGCLAGTIKFGPGWDEPLPAEDWEALGGARKGLNPEAARDILAALRGLTVLRTNADGSVTVGPRGWQMVQAALARTERMG